TPLFRYVYVPFSILGLIAGVFISLDLFPVVIRQDPFADILWVYGIGMSAVLSAAVMFVIRFIAAYAPRTARKALVLGDPQQTTRESDGEEAYLGLVTVIKERRLFADPEVTLQDVARESGLPRNEVSRLINVYSGGNFRALVNRLRVEEMKRLLAEGELSASILEIAIEVGFNSKTSMNRVFRSLEGVTPKEYRTTTLESSRDPPQGLRPTLRPHRSRPSGAPPPGR
ncbi:MAG: helix-turn-helix domain-containing protein, partial [bacterium]